VARWQRIALEAAKQSGRALVPEVTNPITFKALLQNAGAAPELNCLLFSERDGRTLQETARSISISRSLTAMVGSEGGWTDEELAAARAAGWTIVTLGGRTLRAETAAIAVATLLQHIAGDLV
jgi:16S rRNA (uracil1498-N3)-methyltransferase